MFEVQRFLQKHFGHLTLAVSIAFAAVRILQEGSVGHAWTFALAAHHLWSSQSPYGLSLFTNFFFYSPFCGLFLYGPLILVPHLVGVFAHLAVGLAVFLSGLHRLSRHYLSQQSFQFLLVLIAPQLYSALFAFKTEIWIMGILFWALAWMIEGRFLMMAAFLITMVTQWKLQTTPILALLTLAAVLRLNPRWLIAVAVSGIVLFFGPALFLGWNANLFYHQEWSRTLQIFVSQAFYSFDNLYSFFRNFVGWEITFPQASALSTGCGALLAGLTWVMIRRRPQWNLNSSEFILWVLVLGSFSAVSFSPLAQINAYLLFAPVWIATLYLLEREQDQTQQTILFSICTVTVLFMFFGYSDLVPAPWHDRIRHWTLRPVFCDLLAVWVAFRLAMQTSPRPHPDTSHPFVS